VVALGIGAVEVVDIVEVEEEVQVASADQTRIVLPPRLSAASGATVRATVKTVTTEEQVDVAAVVEGEGVVVVTAVAEEEEEAVGLVAKRRRGRLLRR